MGIDEQNSVIQRKTQGGRTEFDARVMSPAKALRLALAKIAANMFGLAITVTTVEQLKLPHAGVQKEAGDDGLLLLFDGASGARAAIKVDRQFLTSLIEVQTMGKVRREAAETRSVTRTDAAIVAPMLDAVFGLYDEQLSEADPGHVGENYRFGDMIEDARSLSLTLDAPGFDLFRVTLDVDDGAKTGHLTLMLPHRKPAPVSNETGEKPDDQSFSLEKNALEAQVAMTAVLTRLRLPLNKICRMEPGMVLPLGTDPLAKAQLLAGDGQVVARVRLGQMNGMRAVRLVASSVEGAPGETENGRNRQSPPRGGARSGLPGPEALDAGTVPAQPDQDLTLLDDTSIVDLEADSLSGQPENTAGTSPQEELSAADIMLAAQDTLTPAGDEHEDA